jgi:hypothetical protein
LYAAGPARADSLRCGHRIVSTGDSPYIVRSLCGEPAATREHFEARLDQRRVPIHCRTAKAPHRRCERLQWVHTLVRIDEWIYDFGPRRFVHYLTFEAGRLIRIEVGGRGARPPASSRYCGGSDRARLASPPARS